MTRFCFFVDFSFDSNDTFRLRYDSVYKELLSFLFQNPKNKMLFHFEGESLEWLEKNHPEFLQILAKLIDRKQIEILGGGFYNPILPLIFPIDRTGQIEKLTSELRRITGKRPRGFYLFDSCWSESLIPVIKNCGFEYVLIKSENIPQKYRNKSPLISNFLGKSVLILEMTENSVDFENRNFNRPENAFVLEKLDLNSGALNFDEIFSFVESNDNFSISLPLEFIKSSDCFEKAAIPESNISDAIINSKKCSNLFNRMMYVSMIVNQWKGDKARRNFAREQLWYSQNGKFYNTENTMLIQDSYKNLLTAERYVREFSESRETVTEFDYDNDGFNDYVCQMEQFSACISPIGAKIFELSAFRNSGNYALSRGFFIDSLLSKDEFDEYKNSSGTAKSQFAEKLFSEIKFNSFKKEISLYAKDEFSGRLPISLRKKYVANSNGFMVQLIFKNESSEHFSGKLLVESNFSPINFYSQENPYNIEVISNDEKILFAKMSQNNFLENISFAQITDSENNISFVYEPNEECGIVFKPIFSDGDFNFSTALCWNIELSAGMEIEKTINFAMVLPKRQHK